MVRMSASGETTPQPAGGMASVFEQPAEADDPRAYYRALRDKTPILRMPQMQGLAEGGAVIISRYEDVQFALRHPEIFTSDMSAAEIGQDRPLIPLQVNPPDHAPYRRRLDPHFSPPAVTAVETSVRELANQLIDKFAGRGSCDFHAEFAVPFPCTIFLSVMGLPLDDLPEMLRWKDDIIRAQMQVADPAEAAALRRSAGKQIYAYFERVIDARTQESAEPRDDVMNKLLTEKVDGERLSREEILDTCYLFLLGGLDTVTASLDCMVSRLAQHPDELHQLIEHPERVPAVVEELLRFETPVTAIPRLVGRDVTIGGVELKAGEHAMLLLASANTDEREFDRAASVDFGRDLNRHFAFGGGPHRCLGSHLARRELKVALEELHRRITDYSLAPGTKLVFSPGIRQLETLPLVFTPERAA